jgi:hypothetical protein
VRFTLHPAPCILHLELFTLHPEPQTIIVNPSIQIYDYSYSHANILMKK